MARRGVHWKMDPCLTNLQDAIEDAHFSAVNYDVIEMPWDSPALWMVLGDREEPLVPLVLPLISCLDPLPIDPTGRACIRTTATVFECAISFESRRVEHLHLKDQLDLALQRWEALISISFESFELGVDIDLMEPEDRRQKSRA